MLQMYLEQLPGLQAELKLLIAEAASAPMMKDSDRQDLIKTWQRQAFGEVPVQKASPAILKMIGIGVKSSVAKPG